MLSIGTTKYLAHECPFQFMAGKVITHSRRPIHRSLPIALALILLVPALIALPVAAESQTYGWGTTVLELTDQGLAIRGIDSASGGLGNIHVVWIQYNDPHFHIHYSKLDGNGNVLIQDLQVVAEDSDELYPQVEADHLGNAHLVWQQYNGSSWVVRYARINSSGVMDMQPANLTQYYSTQPQIVVDSAGCAHVIWEDARTAEEDIYYSRFGSNGTLEASNVRITIDPLSSKLPRMALAPNNDLLITWYDDRYNPAGVYKIYFKRLSSSGAEVIGATFVTQMEGQQRHIDIISGPSGNAHIFWSEVTKIAEVEGGEHYYYDLFHAEVDPSGTVQEERRQLTSGTGNGWAPSVSSNGDGNIHLAWLDGRNGGEQVYYSKMEDTGAIVHSNITITEPVSKVEMPNILILDSGRKAIFWKEVSGQGSDVFYKIDEPDTDHDGYADNFDDFPDEASQWSDWDGDGHGDNPAGILPDAFPDNELQWNDTDGDGWGDNLELAPPAWTQELLDSGDRVAQVQTNYGTFIFELYEQRAPITTANFIDLAQSGFYNGLIFHRVIDDAIIQGGDPLGDGTGGSGIRIPLEIIPSLSHVDGAVSMARSSDPDSASSQFFVCDGDQLFLDGSYAVFGLVIDGMDVVRQIASTPVDGNNKPIVDLFMQDIRIIDPQVLMYGDLYPDDPTQWHDLDEDGHGDNPEGTNGDAFPNDGTQWVDSDGDGRGDNVTGNHADMFPNDATQWRDTDGDGFGDNPNGNRTDSCPWVYGSSELDVLGCPDNDSDGYSDDGDAFPDEPSQWVDSDGDGYGDNPTGALADAFPQNVLEWVDSDGDGIGDNSDAIPFMDNVLFFALIGGLMAVIGVLLGLLIKNKKQDS